MQIEDAEIEAASEAKKKASKGQGAADDVGPSIISSSGLGGYRSTASALNVWRQRRGVALDISGLPGVEKLTAREAELCSTARLLPAHYLSLKDVMMRDAEVHGHISRNDVSGSYLRDSSIGSAAGYCGLYVVPVCVWDRRKGLDAKAWAWLLLLVNWFPSMHGWIIAIADRSVMLLFCCPGSGLL